MPAEESSLPRLPDELADLAEFLDIPVSRTLMGQGCLPDNHPLMVGQTGFWGLEFTHSLTVNADVILGLGTRFAEADSSSWYRGCHLRSRPYGIPPD